MNKIGKINKINCLIAVASLTAILGFGCEKTPVQNPKKNVKVLENIAELNSKNWSDVLSSKDNFVVDFYADWCVACNKLKPDYEKLASNYEGKNVGFGKVDVDKEGSLTENNDIKGIPTLVFYQKGKEVGRIVGAVPYSTLESKMQEFFKHDCCKTFF